jgi:hypothetical protein
MAMDRRRCGQAPGQGKVYVIYGGNYPGGDSSWNKRRRHATGRYDAAFIGGLGNDILNGGGGDIQGAGMTQPRQRSKSTKQMVATA